ncbi:MAG: FISUMP domain-containing protein [Balneolaceae bacterium]
MQSLYESSILLLSILIISSCSTESTPVYQLTTSVEPVEAGSISPVQAEYDEGEVAEITATANDNWVFESWGGDLSGNSNPATILMSSDKNITALFKKQEYAMTINIEGEGSVMEEVVPAKTTDYPHGTILKLTANAERGSYFNRWEGNITGSEPEVQITLTQDREVTAFFETGMKDVEGNIYEVVEIGDQLWMADNLRTSEYSNGEGIQNVIDNEEWENLNIGAWSFYNHDSQFNELYGKLYNWYAVNDLRGICPEGWHVPSSSEWIALTDYLGQNAGGKMKVTDTQYWNSPNTGATNESGFSAMPSGARNARGEFYNMGLRGYWWSSSMEDNDNAFYYFVEHDNGDVTENSFLKSLGRPVRCIAD